jgi:hypothetical protein
MFAIFLAILGWVLLAAGALCIGAAMARGESSAKIAGLKINIVFSGFFSFITGLALVAVGTGMVSG